MLPVQLLRFYGVLMKDSLKLDAVSTSSIFSIILAMWQFAVPGQLFETGIRPRFLQRKDICGIFSLHMPFRWPRATVRHAFMIIVIPQFHDTFKMRNFL